MSSASNKTVIRLKLPPKESTTDDSSNTEGERKGEISKLLKKKEKLRKKEKRLREELYPNVDDESDTDEIYPTMESDEGEKKKKKRGRPKIEKIQPINTLMVKGKANYKTDLGLVKVKVSDGKISR